MKHLTYVFYSFGELDYDLLYFFTSQQNIDEGNGVLNMIIEKVLVLLT
jgi:hypothetical protein